MRKNNKLKVEPLGTKGLTKEEHVSSFSAMVFPFVSIVLGFVTICVVYFLAITNGRANFAFISQMGSEKPAYYFYSFGCCVACGLLLPSGTFYYVLNKRLQGSSPRRRLLNQMSFASAITASLALGAQSVVPLAEGNPVHIFFAINFFGLVFVHAALTTWLYWAASKDSHIKLTSQEQFWIRWKVGCTLSTAVFTVITVLSMGYDVLLHMDLEVIMTNPNFAAILDPTRQSVWLSGGALAEYLTVASMLLYFLSYFFDLRNARVYIRN